MQKSTGKSLLKLGGTVVGTAIGYYLGNVQAGATIGNAIGNAGASAMRDDPMQKSFSLYTGPGNPNAGYNNTELGKDYTINTEFKAPKVTLGEQTADVNTTLTMAGTSMMGSGLNKLRKGDTTEPLYKGLAKKSFNFQGVEPIDMSGPASVKSISNMQTATV